MSRTYKCAVCDGEFETSWSNEEALVEKDQIFGNVAIEECEVVCDDCYQKLIGDHAGQTLKHYNAYHNPATKGSESCNVDGCPWNELLAEKGLDKRSEGK